jgi:hypothetical protein
VNTYNVVLFLHILSLLVGVTAGAIEVICLFRLRAAQTLADAAPWGQLAGQIEKAFPVAILGLFGTGAYMTSDVWGWNTSWIVLPIVGLAVLSLQGPLVAGRRSRALKAALIANGPGPLGGEARRLTRDRLLWGAAFANEGLVLGSSGDDAEVGLRGRDRSTRDRLRRGRSGRPPLHPRRRGGRRAGRRHGGLSRRGAG